MCCTLRGGIHDNNVALLTNFVYRQPLKRLPLVFAPRNELFRCVVVAQSLQEFQPEPRPVQRSLTRLLANFETMLACIDPVSISIGEGIGIFQALLHLPDLCIKNGTAVLELGQPL